MGGWYKHYFKVRLMTLVKQPLFSDRDSGLSIHGLSPHGRNMRVVNLLFSLSFSYWAVGEPNHLIAGEDCVAWHNNWIDVPCYDLNLWICETKTLELLTTFGMFDLYGKALCKMFFTSSCCRSVLQ
jgi:hypothetical protein